jgi:hypothetical protein
MVKINSTKFGSITIDGRVYDRDDNYIVSWDGKIIGLHTAERHLFGKAELEIILKNNPEVIVIGTGDSGLLRVSEEVRSICQQKGIELMEIISREAIIKFNENLDKRVVAFIHVTC